MKQALIYFSLATLICFSALACVWVGYECRVLANESMQLKLSEQKLKTRWGQLLLEESALGALPRIEVEATRGVAMRAPVAADMVVVSQ